MLHVVVVAVTSLNAIVGKMICPPTCAVFMVKVGTPSAVTLAFLSNIKESAFSRNGGVNCS